MSIQSLYNRQSELKVQVQNMAGRKGVGTLRDELETINSRLASLDARRRQMKANVSRNVVGRSKNHVEQTKNALVALVGARIERGYYDELVFRPGNVYLSDLYMLSVAQRCPTHPNVRPLAGYLRALNTLTSAIDDGVIEATAASFDKKGRGTATNHDLYSYSHDGTLILVQVRHAEVTKYGTNVKIQYFVTDGDDVIEIVKGKGNIKKAAQTDPSPDSPLRYVRAQLKAEWRNKIDEKPVKLAAPKVNEYDIYKILHDDDGTLRSVYSGEEYTIGKQKVQKARDGHLGGYYAFLSAEMALRVHSEGVVFNNDRVANKKLVLCKGRAFGQPVAYSNGKMAFSRLVIDEVVSVI